jgi:hypothetical protein
MLKKLKCTRFKKLTIVRRDVGLSQPAKSHKVIHLIWLATTWCLWRLRNNVMFRGILPNLLIFIDQIMYIFHSFFS